MNRPPDDLLGADATDPVDEQASALLDAGRSPDEAGLDAVVAARLRAMLGSRSALRNIPAADPARRESAIAAALAAFGTVEAETPDGAPTRVGTALGGAPTAAQAGVPVAAVRPAAARAAGRWAPQRILGVAAALAVLGLGVLFVGKLGGSSSSKTSGAASGTFAAGATTAAASSLEDQTAAASKAGSGAASTAAAAAGQTAASTAASDAAAATTAAAATRAPSIDRALPSFGAVKDLAALRAKLTVVVSLTPSSAAPAAGTTLAPSTTATTPTTAGAITVGPGADCSAKGTVLATLTWQDTAAYAVLDGQVVLVLDATDCHELART